MLKNPIENGGHSLMAKGSLHYRFQKGRVPMNDYPPTQLFIVPNIILSDPPDAEALNHYGLMRKKLLKDNHPAHCRKILSGCIATQSGNRLPTSELNCTQIT